MLRIAVYDDEEFYRNDLRNKLEYFSINQNIECNFTEFSSSQKLLCSPLDFNILFLDIKLENNINGIEIGMKLRKMNYKGIIILLTSLNCFMKEGYYISAFRYIEKPISQIDFNTIMFSCIDHINKTDIIITIKSLDGTCYLPVNEIIYVETYYRRRMIAYSSQKIVTLETLESIYDRLPKDQFFMPCRSFIVNFQYVFRTKGSIIYMNDGKEITISRNREKLFNAALNRYIGGRQWDFLKSLSTL